MGATATRRTLICRWVHNIGDGNLAHRRAQIVGGLGARDQNKLAHFDRLVGKQPLGRAPVHAHVGQRTTALIEGVRKQSRSRRSAMSFWSFSSWWASLPGYPFTNVISLVNNLYALISAAASTCI